MDYSMKMVGLKEVKKGAKKGNTWLREWQGCFCVATNWLRQVDCCPLCSAIFARASMICASPLTAVQTLAFRWGVGGHWRCCAGTRSPFLYFTTRKPYDVLSPTYVIRVFFMEGQGEGSGNQTSHIAAYITCTRLVFWLVKLTLSRSPSISP